MSSKGRSQLLSNGLTPKQDAFKNNLVKQIQAGKNPNATQAAIEVYDTDDRNTAHVIADGNLRNPTIKKTIQNELEAIGLSREKLMDNVGKLANKTVDKVSAEVVLKSNLALLDLISPRKSEGGIHQTINFNLGYDEAKKALEEIKLGTDEFVVEAE